VMSATLSLTFPFALQIFGIMNEPHDTEGKTDFNQATWAKTSQTVVTAIRKAGATSQMIFLTPTNWANAMSFPDRAADLLNVKNPDGSTSTSTRRVARTPTATTPWLLDSRLWLSS
jgi:hypothetical protein